VIYSIITSLHFTTLYIYFSIDYQAYSRWSTIALLNPARTVEQRWYPHPQLRRSLTTNTSRPRQKHHQRTPRPPYSPTYAIPVHLPKPSSIQALASQRCQVQELVHHYSPSPTHPLRRHQRRLRPHHQLRQSKEEAQTTRTWSTGDWTG
jgi:hypothetical protein